MYALGKKNLFAYVKPRKNNVYIYLRKFSKTTKGKRLKPTQKVLRMDIDEFKHLLHFQKQLCVDYYVKSNRPQRNTRKLVSKKTKQKTKDNKVKSEPIQNGSKSNNPIFNGQFTPVDETTVTEPFPVIQQTYPKDDFKLYEDSKSDKPIFNGQFTPLDETTVTEPFSRVQQTLPIDDFEYYEECV